MEARDLEEISDETAKRIVHIIGDSSAAFAALAERDRRRDAGEDAVILIDRRAGRLLVGPRPETPKQG